MLDNKKNASLKPSQSEIVMRNEMKAKSEYIQDYMRCQAFQDKQYITVGKDETHILDIDDSKTVFPNPFDIDI